jgi:hypothetical protein
MLRKQKSLKRLLGSISEGKRCARRKKVVVLPSARLMLIGRERPKSLSVSISEFSKRGSWKRPLGTRNIWMSSVPESCCGSNVKPEKLRRCVKSKKNGSEISGNVSQTREDSASNDRNKRWQSRQKGKQNAKLDRASSLNACVKIQSVCSRSLHAKNNRTASANGSARCGVNV